MDAHNIEVTTNVVQSWLCACGAHGTVGDGQLYEHANEHEVIDGIVAAVLDDCITAEGDSA